MKDFTLVVPTYNRHNYLDRLLEAYEGENLNIIIVDATKERYKKKLKKNIKYIHSKKASSEEQCHIGVKAVTTKYCTINADDDYITLAGTRKCIKFLDKNDDFCCARGSIIVFENYIYDNFVDYRYVFNLKNGQDSVEDDDVVSRLNRFSFDFPITSASSVYRTSVINNIYKNIAKIIHKINYSDISALAEWIAIILQLTEGKFKDLSIPYHIREIKKNSIGDGNSRYAEDLKEQYQNNKKIIKDVFFEYAVKKVGSKKQAYDISKLSMKLLSDYIKKVLEFRDNQGKTMYSLTQTQVDANEMLKQYPEIMKYSGIVKKYNIYGGFYISRKKTRANLIASMQVGELYNAIELFFRFHKDEKFIIYGAGSVGKIIVGLYGKNIEFFVDIRKPLNDDSILNKKIYKPESIKNSNLPILISVLGRENEILKFIKYDMKLENEVFVLDV